MNTKATHILSWACTAPLLAFLASDYGASKMMVQVTQALIADRGIATLPAPTRLLLAMPTFIPLIPLVLAATLVAGIWFIKRRLAGEGLVFELLTHAAVWWLGTTHLCGVALAAFLPWAILGPNG